MTTDTTDRGRNLGGKHVGRHHFAGQGCGEWRPIAGEHACPVCQGPCPCGRFYVRPSHPTGPYTREEN